MSDNRPVTLLDLEEFKDKITQQFHEERKKDLEQIMAILKPISETYQTASMLGKWTMAGMVFISVLLGILLSLRSMFNK
jgi:hypothetical protein